MAASHCPGQDRRFWTPDDITSVTCPECGTEVELFKDEGKRRCPGCGAAIGNPRVLEGCASWCAFAEACTGIGASDKKTAVGGKRTGESRGPSLAEGLIDYLCECGCLEIKQRSELEGAARLAEKAGINSGYPQVAVTIAFVLHIYFMFEKAGGAAEQQPRPHPLLSEIFKPLPREIVRAFGNVVRNYTGTWPGGAMNPEAELVELAGLSDAGPRS